MPFLGPYQPLFLIRSFFSLAKRDAAISRFFAGKMMMMNFHHHRRYPCGRAVGCVVGEGENGQIEV